MEFANLGSGGTRMPRTNWQTLSSFEILIPDDQTIQRFNSVTFPFLAKIEANIEVIRVLENLRDTLLPKLMSGDIRVEYEDTPSETEAA